VRGAPSSYLAVEASFEYHFSALHDELSARLFGQHLANKIVVTALHAHLNNEQVSQD
jgi:hypothetical protein